VLFRVHLAVLWCPESVSPWNAVTARLRPHRIERVHKILYRGLKLSAMPQQRDLLRMTKAVCDGKLLRENADASCRVTLSCTRNPSVKLRYVVVVLQECYQSAAMPPVAPYCYDVLLLLFVTCSWCFLVDVAAADGEESHGEDAGRSATLLYAMRMSTRSHSTILMLLGIISLHARRALCGVSGSQTGKLCKHSN
jgi:hypothetical protein